MSRYILRGGTLIDGTGAAPRPDSSVFICEGRIEGLHGIAERKAEHHPDTVAIDCTGHTVMPGLVDGHVHLTFDEAASGDDMYFHRQEPYLAIAAAWNVQKLLRAGVTSCLEPDSLWGLGASVRAAVEAGMAEGPRMVVGGQALVPFPDPIGNDVFGASRAPAHHRAVRGHDDIVAEIRRAIINGADWIKLIATAPLPGKSHEQPLFTASELQEICDVAHELGTPVAAHVRHPKAIKDAARAGVDLIVHASYMDDECLDLIVESGAAIMPTYTFLANFLEHGHRVGSPSRFGTAFGQEMEDSDAMLSRAHQAGVKLVCGSESGFSVTPYGHWHTREMELFVERLGMTPLEAITCATGNGGEIIMRRPTEIGTVTHGSLADVLVVAGDPLEDIRVLGDRSRLHHVFCRGEEIDLQRPWPTRTVYSRERVMRYSRQILTWERAHRPEPETGWADGVEDDTVLVGGATSCPCMM
jgi:imidazolonepropionase-like amidohydrolase